MLGSRSDVATGGIVNGGGAPILFAATLPGMLRIDLNADAGESFGAWTMGDDEALIPSLTSVNVACGMHAGDPHVMRRTVRLARAHGVAIGAHPGYDDLAGFGRRALAIEPGNIEDLVIFQIGALAAIAAAEDARLTHVKPHGALYTRAATDVRAAAAIARAIVRVDRQLILVGPPGSRLLDAGRELGLRVAAEAFADRAYERDGSLRSRSLSDALVTDPDEVVTRVLRMVTDKIVIAVDGTPVPLEAETICLHGDTPGAARLARHVREALEAHGVRVMPLAAAVS